MSIRKLEDLTKEELIELVKHERRGGLVERPDEYAYFSDWYAKDAPDEIGVSALHMARHAWLEGIRFADLFPAAPQPAEPSRSDPDTEREKWLASLFPEDRMFEEIDQMARESYKQHMSLKRGQMVVRADSMDSHIVWATKRWIEKNEPVKVPSDDDSLTIAYMCGHPDGKRSTTPEGWQLVPIEPTAEMKTAAICVEVYPDSPIDTGGITWAEIAEIYAAMLAAAPSIKQSLTVDPTDSEMLDWLIEESCTVLSFATGVLSRKYKVIDFHGDDVSVGDTARDAISKAMRGEE